jgi:tetratricopeptide (TPR) repeat protein
MTLTLNLFEQLLARARRCQEAGQISQALSSLRRLARFPDLPADVAEEVQARLGEFWLRRRRFRRARRHLAAALGYRPDSPRYHFLLGLALHHDPAGDLARAARHYRRSLHLSPRQPRCLAEAGLLAITRGREDEGLDLLRRAAALAPADAGIVGKFARGLGQCGRPNEGLRAVRAALFRQPRCPRLRRLWVDLELSGLHRRQEMARAHAARGDEPVLLPFIRLVGKVTASPTFERADAPASRPGRTWSGSACGAAGGVCRDGSCSTRSPVPGCGVWAGRAF